MPPVGCASMPPQEDFLPEGRGASRGENVGRARFLILCWKGGGAPRSKNRRAPGRKRQRGISGRLREEKCAGARRNNANKTRTKHSAILSLHFKGKCCIVLASV